MFNPTLPANNPYDPTNALDDIPGFHWALHESLQSRMHERDPDKSFRPHHSHNTFQKLRSLLTKIVLCDWYFSMCGRISFFEDKDLLAYVDRIKHGITVAPAHGKLPSSLAGRLAGYIVPSLSTSGT